MSEVERRRDKYFKACDKFALKKAVYLMCETRRRKAVGCARTESEAAGPYRKAAEELVIAEKELSLARGAYIEIIIDIHTHKDLITPAALDG